MNSIDFIRNIFFAFGNQFPADSERLKDVEFLFEDKKERLLATLPPDTREAFEELFDIDTSVKDEYKDYGVAIGIQTASVMNEVMNNPFIALNNLTKTYRPIEQAEQSSIAIIDNYIKNHRATQ